MTILERMDVWMSKRSLPIRIIYDALRIFLLEHGTIRATALAYTSLLAIVPMLVLLASISFYLGTGDLFLEYLRTYIPGILYSFLPENNPELIATIGVIIDNVILYLKRIMGARLDFLGGVGGIGLLFTFILTINTIETNINIIWGINETRSYLRKVIIFIPFLFLFTGCIGIASILLHYTVDMLKPLSLLAIVLFGLWIMYCYMPYVPEEKGFWKAAITKTKKRWLPSLIAAVFTFAAIFTFTLAMGFLQASIFKNWSVLYGSLAVFPMLMFLLFGFWSIVLFGNALCWRITERKSHQKYILERIANSSTARSASRTP